MTIKLWDIPSTLGCWSPHAWKIRYCLNLKKIPHKTEWVELPNISAHCQNLGIPSTGTGCDGKPYWTLPMIHDPATGVYLADSPRIAEYLERQYPSPAGPHIFPHNTIGLQIDFDARMQTEMSPLYPFAIPPLWHIQVNPASQVYFRETREKFFGKKLEDVAPTGEKYVEEWAKVEAGFGRVAAWYAKMADQGPFIMGKEPSWADFVVGGYLMWFNKAWGDDDEKWKTIISWNGGRWKKLLDALEQYSDIN